jgi:hypothetical protein
MSAAKLDNPLPNYGAPWPPQQVVQYAGSPEGWVHFEFEEEPGQQLAFQGLEGFIPYVDIDPEFQATGYRSDLNRAYPTCGGTPSDYPGHMTNATGTLDEKFANADEWFGTTDEGHFQMDRNQEIPAVNSNEGMFFDSTSATQTGDIVRGVVPQGSSFTELDHMSYPDPNDFCWDPGSGKDWTTRQAEQVTTWSLVEFNPHRR